MKTMSLMTTSDLDCGSQGRLHLKNFMRNGDNTPFLLKKDRALIAEIKGLLELRNTACQISTKTKIDQLTVEAIISQIRA